jgi:uncharacterized protein YdeI (YjbR/CyaY-like superfamily)
MSKDLELLDLRSRRQWRAWLGRHHAGSPGVWLVFQKQHTGVASVAYEDAVREALCYGWIDSLIKKLDDDRYARKFTPRTSSSSWSAINRTRYADLEAAGALAAPGRAASPAGAALSQPPPAPELPEGEFLDALKTHPKARRYFESLSPSHRRHYVGWIYMAKRPETREKRRREAIARLSAGQKLGLK